MEKHTREKGGNRTKKGISQQLNDIQLIGIKRGREVRVRVGSTSFPSRQVRGLRGHEQFHVVSGPRTPPLTVIRSHPPRPHRLYTSSYVSVLTMVGTLPYKTTDI